MTVTTQGNDRYVAARRSETFTPEQLARLRTLVRCMGCGAVPQDTGQKRTNPFTGDPTDLPLIVTKHRPGCSVAATREGVRAPARQGAGRLSARVVDQRPCAYCAEPMDVPEQAPRTKRFCSSQCRTYASRERRSGKPKRERADVMPCQHCAAPIAQPKQTVRKYCSTSCASRAARARAKTKKVAA